MFGQNVIHGRKTFEGHQDLLVTSIFYTLQGEGPFAGRPAVFLRLAHCNLKCSFCWGWYPNSGRHPVVTTAYGDSKKLGKVEVGDKLLTLGSDGRLAETTVTNVLRREVDMWMRIKIDGTIYYMTPEHPLFTNRGLLEAKDLRVGDEVLHTDAHQIRSYKRAINNPMNSPASLAKKVKNTDYKRVGAAISRAIAESKAVGTYVHPFNKLTPAQQEVRRKKAAVCKLGNKNPNYNPDSPNRNFYDMKARIQHGGCVCRCGNMERLEVHDVDYDPTNDRKSNLRIVCKSCHTRSHKKWKNFPWYKVKHGGVHAKNGRKVERIQLVDRAAYPPSTKPRRLPVMNLTCAPHPTYLADKMWTHNCDTNFSHGDWMPHAVVVERLLAACAGKINVEDCVLIITGGEPSLQSNALQMLLTLTSAYFNKVQIESNGLLAMDLPNSTYLVVSPKCTEGLIPFAHYLKPHKDTLHRANCLKFVITADDTSPYYTVPDWAFKWRDKHSSQRPIYVSPMAEYKRLPDLTHLSSGNLEQRSAAEQVSFWENNLLDKDKVRANHEYAARYCLDHGLYLSMQMQLFAGLP